MDLGKQLKFLETVADMMLTLEASKQVILLELTLPWEDHIEEANEGNRAKYAELMEEY